MDLFLIGLLLFDVVGTAIIAIIVNVNEAKKPAYGVLESVSQNVELSTVDTHYEEGYREMAVHVLLLLFTFGIYLYVWIYKTTKFTNTLPNAQYRDPTTKLLLCLFVPFYIIYWTSKTCNDIERFSKSRSIPCNIQTLCVVLSFFIPVVVPIIMQSKLNDVIQSIINPLPVQQDSKRATDNEMIDALRQYKKLLDTGVLTQEEFDAKKKQLLGL